MSSDELTPRRQVGVNLLLATLQPGSGRPSTFEKIEISRTFSVQRRFSTMPTSKISTFKIPTSKIPIFKIQTSKIQTFKIPISEMPTLKMPTSEMPTIRIPTLKMPTIKMTTSEMPILKMPNGFFQNAYFRN
jgi:hypothetical protein